jgi:ribose 5-phosphate isomerase B
MKVVVSADHRGAAAAQGVVQSLQRQGHEARMLGELTGQPSDYPEVAFLVGNAIARGEAEYGVLICGTGIGMSIAANKIKGVRAAVVHDELTAQISRSHNNANVLCLSADLLGQRLIENIVAVWLHTPFEGGRHTRRIHKIEAIEQGKDPGAITE